MQKDQNLIYNKKSNFQQIELYKYDTSGIKLYLDGHIQFSEIDEYIYHESLGVVPMLFSKATKILICGGGDGLLLRTLLNFSDVKEIHIVELDGEMINMTKIHPEMRRLSEDSLYSDKVKVMVDDAWDYIWKTKEEYDVILCDFPDPNFTVLNKLYSKEFYSRCYDLLSENGLICVQSCFEYGLYAVIKDTLRSVFPEIMPYRSYSKSFYVSGFLMGTKRKFKQIRAFPDWTKRVDEKAFVQMTTFTEDEKILMNTKSSVNSLQNNLLYTNSYLVNKGWELNYRYSEDTVVLDNVSRWLSYDENSDGLKEDIEHVKRNYNIVAYVPEGCSAVKKILKKAGLNSYIELTSIYIDATLEKLDNLKKLITRLKMNDSLLKLTVVDGKEMLNHKGLKFLIEEYFSEHKDVFFDMLELDDIFDEKAIYHYYERPDGTPVAFNKFVYEPLYREYEIAYGRGTSKENTYMILNSCALDITKHPGTKMYANVPYEKVAFYGTKLGFDVDHKYSVFTWQKGF